MNNQLPLQDIPDDRHIQLLPIKEFKDPTSYVPHRYNFMLLMWATAGKGKHRIDFKTYEVLPGYLFFIHQGQIHEVIEFPNEGWIVMFDDSFNTGFLSANRHEELLGMMELLSQVAYIKIHQGKQIILDDLFCHLKTLLSIKTRDFKLAQCYVLLILLYACKQHPYFQNENYLPLADRFSIPILKASIEEHFIKERKVAFDSDLLNIDAQKLNLIAKEVFNKTVFQLITDRLLVEPAWFHLDINNAPHAVIYDMPSTLTGIDDAIEMVLQKGFTGRTAMQEIIEQRELNNFRRVLQIQIDKSPYAKEVIEIIDEF